MERAPGERLTGRGRAYALVCVAALVGATVVATVKGGWPSSSPREVVPSARQAGALTQPATSAGNEVAQEVKSPETASAAAPLQADSTPAAVDVPATLAEVQPAVKMPKTAVSPNVPASSTKVMRLGALGQACCVAATCATLACAGEAPVRRGDPPSESCPPGAKEAMEQLRIFMGMDAGATFPGRAGEVISVREGSTEQELVGPLGKLPDRTRLMGHLLFGNGRVYGRITEARTPGNETVPVCLELLGEDLKPGLTQKPGGGADTARVFSSNLIRPVRRFE